MTHNFYFSKLTFKKLILISRHFNILAKSSNERKFVVSVCLPFVSGSQKLPGNEKSSTKYFKQF